jgi:hypothetical protein
MSLSFLLLAGAMLFVSMLVMSFFYNWLDARAASWDRLARLYETEIGPGSTFFAGDTIAMNDRSYRGIATIGVSRKGLYLALDRSHQFLHPPLLIPWSDIEAIPSQTGARCAFRIKATATKMRVEDPVVREIQKFLAGEGPRRTPLAA